MNGDFVALLLDDDDAILAYWTALRLLNEDAEAIPADVVRRLVGQGRIIQPA